MRRPPEPGNVCGMLVPAPGLPVRVVIGEDNYLVREGIRQLLDDVDSVEVAGVGVDLDTVHAAVERHDPDVLITDIRMPPSNTDEGLRIAYRLRQERPHVGVVILSQHADPEYAISLLDDGAAGRGYLLKERLSDITQLTHAIHEVARGGSIIDPFVVDALMAARGTANRSLLGKLTPRERLVLSCIAQGKSNAGISEQLGATERSVEKHISSIFAKLSITDQPDLHRRVKAALLFLSAAPS
jgi:DNA-binding NarL/FixJ family response regulator